MSGGSNAGGDRKSDSNGNAGDDSFYQRYLKLREAGEASADSSNGSGNGAAAASIKKLSDAKAAEQKKYETQTAVIYENQASVGLFPAAHLLRLRSASSRCAGGQTSCCRRIATSGLTTKGARRRKRTSTCDCAMAGGGRAIGSRRSRPPSRMRMAGAINARGTDIASDFALDLAGRMLWTSRKLSTALREEPSTLCGGASGCAP